MFEISTDNKKRYLMRFPFIDDFYLMGANDEEIAKLYKEVREKDEKGEFDSLWEMM